MREAVGFLCEREIARKDERRIEMAIKIYDTYDTIAEACCEAWNSLVAVPDRITSITQRDWAIVS